MIKHHLTTYTADGKRIAESWLQINAFGRCFCFSKKRMTINK